MNIYERRKPSHMRTEVAPLARIPSRLYYRLTYPDHIEYVSVRGVDRRYWGAWLLNHTDAEDVTWVSPARAA